MARILQIRRGTTQQNDNFTGMPGEITFDTDAKTLRVHDGQMLGGYALAREDAQSGVAAFDISTVPDSFWQSVLDRLMPAAPRVANGNQMPLGQTTYIEYIFDIAQPALAAQAILVCTNAQAGYNPGDEVMSFGIGDNVAYQPNIFSDNNGLHVRLYVAGQQFWLPNKETGNRNNITPENWRIKFRVYY